MNTTDKVVRFRDLAIGQQFDFEFDFVSPNGYNSFFKRCIKISPRKYRDEQGITYQVSSINCIVYNAK